MPQLKSVFAWCALLATLACGGGNGGAGSNSSSTTEASGPLSGNWQISLQFQDKKGKPRPLSGFLQESADGSITGSMLLADFPCSGVGAANGAANGSSLSLTVSPTGVNVNLTGTIGPGTSMSGTYTILSSGCRGSDSRTGDWTANQVSPFTGSIKGDFMSKEGTQYSVSGSVTQAQNNGNASANLSGTLNITGFPCFTSATISGSISGTAVVMNLLGTNGLQIGQITGTSALDGQSLTGAYSIIPHQPGSPCQSSGQNGSVSLTL